MKYPLCETMRVMFSISQCGNSRIFLSLSRFYVKSTRYIEFRTSKANILSFTLAIFWFHVKSKWQKLFGIFTPWQHQWHLKIVMSLSIFAPKISAAGWHMAQQVPNIHLKKRPNLLIFQSPRQLSLDRWDRVKSKPSLFFSPEKR